MMARDELALLNGITATTIAATLLINVVMPNGPSYIRDVSWGQIGERLASWREALDDGMIFWGP